MTNLKDDTDTLLNLADDYYRLFKKGGNSFKEKGKQQALENEIMAELENVKYKAVPGKKPRSRFERTASLVHYQLQKGRNLHNLSRDEQMNETFILMKLGQCLFEDCINGNHIIEEEDNEHRNIEPECWIFE